MEGGDETRREIKEGEKRGSKENVTRKRGGRRNRSKREGTARGREE